MRMHQPRSRITVWERESEVTEEEENAQTPSARKSESKNDEEDASTSFS